ncbi:hypothetical protein AVEN_212141-1 [Araneus ventricosus]|uniref:Mariner Mos1 transposase n=1 Tax=Araneus ventricosus TaxID=182803 RepID=A0A4Y2M8Z3_ARAVE|nr:hypothetical protein AVEN_212141-1 [Araneus ventricosus]
MLRDGVILLHDNTHNARKTQELLRKFKWEDWSHQSTAQVRHSKHLYGTRFSSNSAIETIVENWLNGQGRDFYKARLNKFTLRSDKCLNIFRDDVEK